MAVPSRPPNRGSRLPRERRREQLLDVTAELVLRGGVEAVTMEGVAAAAGVSKGLGYAYFANRAELLQALLDRERAGLQARVAAALETATTFEDRIRATTAGWFDTVEEHGALLGALLQAIRVDGLQATRDAYYRQIEDFYGGLAAEEFGIPQEEAVTAAAIFISGLNGVVDRWTVAGRPRAEVEETYITAVMGAVRALAEAHAPARR
ncbi:MAG TPA: TetR/AcrR family transcriptional regulator [Acidimicrobiales bacterium]|nr:TetR/AcrR family transcriptional regulator [Acidimicrobiales bacterium]